MRVVMPTYFQSSMLQLCLRLRLWLWLRIYQRLRLRGRTLVASGDDLLEYRDCARSFEIVQESLNFAAFALLCTCW
jgi:hypothetical protein